MGFPSIRKKLYRACSLEEAVWTVKNKTVGGYKKKEGKIVPIPNEVDIVKYVAGHEGFVQSYITLSEEDLTKAENDASPPVETEGKIVEYTDDFDVAKRFGRATGYIIEVTIQQQFLRKGSGTESGWFACAGAPLDTVKYIKRNNKNVQSFLPTKGAGLMKTTTIPQTPRDSSVKNPQGGEREETMIKKSQR